MQSAQVSNRQARGVGVAAQIPRRVQEMAGLSNLETLRARGVRSSRKGTTSISDVGMVWQGLV
jgi:hypothetical protein